MMNTPNPELLTRLQRAKIVPVVSLPSADAALILAELLLKHDLPVVEITFRTAYAASGLAAIHARFPEMTLLAGTVLNAAQADQAVNAGADALVTPGFTRQLAEYAQSIDTPLFPGVCTPSEVQCAMEVGCHALKFFPAENMGGVKMLSLFGALYQDAVFMPTGGINPDNVKNYLALENVLCCGGTWLCPEQLMVDGKWQEIEQRIETAMKTVRTQAGSKLK